MPSDKLVLNDAENNSITTKSRSWVAVCWLDTMFDGWQSSLDLLLQYPYCYCVHDKDIDKAGDPRKPHVHIMITFPNTTTYKHALRQFRKLSASSLAPCCNTAFAVNNVRFMYEYLIHNTDQAKKDGKHQYDVTERICGLGFDIGLFEQISLADKKQMVIELSEAILERRITNYADLYMFVLSNYDSSYLDLLTGYSGHFDRLCRGVAYRYRSK